MQKVFFRLRSFIVFLIHCQHKPESLFYASLRDKIDHAFTHDARLFLKRNKTIIQFSDPGAVKKHRSRTVAAIYKHSTSTKRNSRLIFNLVRYIKPKIVFELGTSLGVNTIYLAKPYPVKVISFEGAAPILSIAKEVHNRYFPQGYVEYIAGNIHETLPPTLKRQQPDMIFMDAEHTFAATITFFELCKIHARVNSRLVIVLDDIYWSPGMKLAWENIKRAPEVSGTIDLYTLGIVFFDPQLLSEHHKWFII